DELRFQLAGMLLSQLLDAFVKRKRAAANDLFLDAARFADGLVLQVDDRVDDVLTFQRADAVLPTPPGEGAAAGRGKSFHVQFRRPSARDAVFEFEPWRLRGQTVRSGDSC